MSLSQILLVFEPFIVQIFPDRLYIISIRIINSFWWSVFMSWRCTEYLLLIFLRRLHYLMIGLKVLLLIKIHFLYNLFAPLSFYLLKQIFIVLMLLFYKHDIKWFYLLFFYFYLHFVLVTYFDQIKDKMVWKI